MSRSFALLVSELPPAALKRWSSLFSRMPADTGMAFVVVQHLDPTRQSSMPEILARLTKMPVHMAAEDMKVRVELSLSDST